MNNKLFFVFGGLWSYSADQFTSVYFTVRSFLKVNCHIYRITANAKCPVIRFPHWNGLQSAGSISSWLSALTIIGKKFGLT